MPVVYTADTLPSRYKVVAQQLSQALRLAGVTTGELCGTRYVWARDYMPVPTPSGQLIWFRYAPDYLQSARWRLTITDSAAVTTALGLRVLGCELVVDAGNIVRSGSRVLMTDKVFRENPTIAPIPLGNRLAEALETDSITWPPAHPDDFTGHAHGLVHLVYERTALVNDYGTREPQYWRRLRNALRRAGIEWVPVPCKSYTNRTYTSAVGDTLTFFVFLPRC